MSISGAENVLAGCIDAVEGSRSPTVQQYGNLVTALMERQAAELRSLHNLHYGKLEIDPCLGAKEHRFSGTADLDKLEELVSKSSANDSTKEAMHVNFPFFPQGRAIIVH